jgi:tocopherol cyclase
MKIIFLSFLIFLSGFNTLLAQDLSHGVNFSRHKCLPGYGLKKLGNPEIFQGNKKKKSYFEGWYFKMVSSVDSSTLCIIPGIALSQDGSGQHAFIQIIDGKTSKTDYYSFPIEEFSFSRKGFAIKIGQNYFSPDKIILNLHSDSTYISGEVYMSNQVQFPKAKILNPGIMGWYRFVPFMQCYHGVVSLTHQLQGTLVMNGVSYNFNKGIGYIEKDWGSSMPSAWIWMQSNNFSHGNSSFMLSIANIPWLGKSFTGFLGFFLHDSTLYRFATYTHAKLKVEESGPDSLFITIKDRKNIFFIEASHKNAGLLQAPVKGAMDRRIPESNDAKLKLTVQDHKGNVIFCDSTAIGGLEKVASEELMKDLLKKGNR